MQPSTTSPVHDAGIAAARARLGLPADVASEAFVVHRLVPPEGESLLVVFGPADRAVGVALVDARTGNVESSARLPGTGPALPIDDRAARAIAGAGEDAMVRLVWRPSRASMSPLLPFWEVHAGGGTLRYVDQQGRTWTAAQIATPAAGG